MVETRNLADKDTPKPMTMGEIQDFIRETDQIGKIIEATSQHLIFVIMPFSAANDRNGADLEQFFQTNLKDRIERYPKFKRKYHVQRSDREFDLNARIISNLYEAEYVLCDLSGHRQPNHNVMLELGIRFGISNRPVILFREEHEDNKSIVDLPYFIYPYQTEQYSELEDYIIGKIEDFESGREVFQSPVVRTLETEPSIIAQVRRHDALYTLFSARRQIEAYPQQIGGNVMTFLVQHGIEPSIERTDQIITFLQRKSEELENLPWSDFEFLPAIAPSLSTLLQKPVLDDYAPWLISQIVGRITHLYYAVYLSSHSSDWMKSLFRIVWFVSDTFALVALFRWSFELVRSFPNGAVQMLAVNDMIGRIIPNLSQVLVTDGEKNTMLHSLREFADSF